MPLEVGAGRGLGCGGPDVSSIQVESEGDQGLDHVPGQEREMASLRAEDAEGTSQGRRRRVRGRRGKTPGGTQHHTHRPLHKALQKVCTWYARVNCLKSI